MSAVEVIELCTRRRVTLTAGANGKLKFSGSADAIDVELKSLLAAHKTELLRLVGPCPDCGRSLDRGRCWKCGHRKCEVCRTRSTGSLFIAYCCQCQFATQGTV